MGRIRVIINEGKGTLVMRILRKEDVWKGESLSFKDLPISKWAVASNTPSSTMIDALVLFYP
jgi:hypothetical protein